MRVQNGRLEGASLVHLDGVLESLTIEGTDGLPWNGELSVAPSGRAVVR